MNLTGNKSNVDNKVKISETAKKKKISKTAVKEKISETVIKEKFCEYAQDVTLNDTFKEKIWDDFQSGNMSKSSNKKYSNKKYSIEIINIVEKIAAIILVLIIAGGIVGGFYLRNKTTANDNNKNNEELIHGIYTEKEYQYIKNKQAVKESCESEKENLLYMQQYGIDKTSVEILRDFEYKVRLYQDATELWECSTDRLIISSIRGAIIYDRNKKQVAATIDLQDIGGYYRRWEWDEDSVPYSRAFVKENRLYIFNEASGRVVGKCYIYNLAHIDKECVKALQPERITDNTDRLVDEWNEQYGKKTKSADNYFGTLNSDEYECEEYAANALGWSAANQDEIEYYSTIITDDRWKNTNIKLLTKNTETYEKETEELTLGFDEAVTVCKDSERLPVYVYTGDDEMMRSIIDYIQKKDEWGNYERAEGHEFEHYPIVVIPTVQIYDIVTDGDKKAVFAVESETGFYRVGNSFMVNFDAAGIPMRFDMKYTGGEWKVEESYADSFGANKQDEVFKGYAGSYAKYLKFTQNEGEWDSEYETTHHLRQYVCEQQLDIRYVNYEHQYINLFDIDMDMDTIVSNSIKESKEAENAGIVSVEYGVWYGSIVTLGLEAVDTLEDIVLTGITTENDKEKSDTDDDSMLEKSFREVAVKALEEIIGINRYYIVGSEWKGFEEYADTLKTTIENIPEIFLQIITDDEKTSLEKIQEIEKYGIFGQSFMAELLEQDFGTIMYCGIEMECEALREVKEEIGIRITENYKYLDQVYMYLLNVRN